MGKGRSPCCDKAGVKKGPWSQVEDLKLISFIQKHGHSNWRALPKLAGLARCGKSCRLRWVNYLRPDLKRGNFAPEEEETIIKLHEELGNKWSKIASYFPGRTDNEIKNVWNTHLKKRLKAKGSLDKVLDGSNKDSSKQVLEHRTSPKDDTTDHSSFSSTSYSSQASFSDHLMIEHVHEKDEIGSGVDKINGDLHDELIEIPFEPNLDLWDLLEGDSEAVDSEVQSNELQAPLDPVSENDSKNCKDDGGGSWWWLVYLENELGLDPIESTPQATNGSNDEMVFEEGELFSDMVI